MVTFNDPHESERYAFAGPTLDELCTLLSRYRSPVVLCAPRLGEAMERRGHPVATLDIDNRFAHLRGYIPWNVRRPAPLGFKPDLIVCDPPFFGVSLPELFGAVHLLASFDPTTPVALSYLSRGAPALMGAFAPFGLQPTAYRPSYMTAANSGFTSIEFFANFDDPLWSHPRVAACG